MLLKLVASLISPIERPIFDFLRIRLQAIHAPSIASYASIIVYIIHIIVFPRRNYPDLQHDLKSKSLAMNNSLPFLASCYPARLNRDEITPSPYHLLRLVAMGER